MKVTLKWLQDYVKLPLPSEELAEKLTMSGTEVGAIEAVGADWDGDFSTNDQSFHDLPHIELIDNV